MHPVKTANLRGCFTIGNFYYSRVQISTQVFMFFFFPSPHHPHPRSAVYGWTGACSPFFTSSASSIIDAWKMLQLHLQLGGCEPLGGDDSLALVGGVTHGPRARSRMHTPARARALTHSDACARFPSQPCNPSLSPPSCPIKLKNLRK